MSAYQKSDHALMKQTNHGLVLQFIQGYGPISRKAIAEISGLSTASVSKMTGELIERGLVQEVGEADGEGRVGRREVLLRLNAHAGYVVGVMLGMHAIICVLTDLDSRVLHAIEAPLPVADQVGQANAPFTPDAIIETTIQSIEHLLTLVQIDRARLLGIGVAINGIVDPDTGVSHMAPHFGWHHVPLAAPLAEHFGISVLLENDGRALTIAEQWFGAGRGVDHFVTVVAGHGIGAGVIANGQIYRGAMSGAGEFGHIIFQPDGPRCSCGKHGCLEALAAEPAILQQVDEALAAGTPSVLAHMQPLNLEAVARAADAGDALAQRVLSSAGRWFGIGIASLVNILNPRLLIIKGEIVCAGRWYFEPMQTALREHVFDSLADTLRILTEPSENYMWARGAACVMLSALFASPAHQQEPGHMHMVRALARPELNP
jgi:predicted NBD/HSP70 family sugar kinase